MEENEIMECLISIIIPCYKVEAYLARCIESVIAQTYHNIEIILIDDESPDGCGKICDSYAEKDQRIIVIHQKNKGLSGARNTGINLARGDYIFFLDSDDCIYPDTISKLYIQAVKKNAELVSAGFYQGKKPEFVLEKSGTIFEGNGAEVLSYVLQNATWSAWGKLYNRALIGNDRFAEGYLYEDFEFVPRQYLKAKRCVHIDESLYFYFERETSIMGGSKFRLKPYYVDFAKKNLNAIRDSNYTLEEKNKVLAGFYRHLIWDVSKPERVYGIKQEKDFTTSFSKLLQKEISEIFKCRFLEWNNKLRYLVLFVSPTLFEFMFCLSYQLKRRKMIV